MATFDLVLENVRSFSKRQSVPIAPLTILTGENSTGKSTILAMLAAVLDQDGFPIRPKFNTSPYDLGSYETIATYKGGKFGRAKSFVVGFQNGGRNGTASLLATFRESDGQPQVSHVEARSPSGSFSIDLPISSIDEAEGVLSFLSDNISKKVSLKLPSRELRELRLSLLDLVTTPLLRSPETEKEDRFRVLSQFSRLLADTKNGRATSLAPIRTRPERVYSHPTDSYEPSGEHIPFVLDRMLRNASTKDAKAVEATLHSFGVNSGLFSDVKPKTLGRNKPGSPFQIDVMIAGKRRNLVDVGYGVSQALPLLVEATLARRQEWLLIQQPEVHLHPRAQAELGSMFVRLVQEGKHVVVETHSDFVIDRVRTDVAKGKLDPKQVQVIFLERASLDTRVHVLKLNAKGDIEDPPPGYRDFFLQEQLRVLSR